MMDAAAGADLKKITLGVRPESFHVASEAGAGAVQLRVNLVEELGADAYVHGTLLQEDELNAKQLVVRFDGRVPPRIGDTISVEIRPEETHAFNPETGERLG
jgi:multiple sugar transport system ATP-binding protein